MRSIIEDLKKINQQLQLEKLIIGIEEPIFVKGVGEILAKVDSGNGAFNVIHGEDFYYQGDKVVFTTFDENGTSHRLSKKVQDKIEINVGAGHSEERPVILLDVSFGDDEYLNVPFSISNRSNNKNKILLGREFIVKELDALIDASASSISDKNIEIDVEIPITEAKDPSGATTKLGKALKTGWGIAKGIGKVAKTLGEDPNGKGITYLGNALINDIKSARDYIRNSIQPEDKKIIFKALNQKMLTDKIDGYKVVKNPQIIKILDFMGDSYGNIPNLFTDNQEPSNNSLEKTTTNEPITTNYLDNENNQETPEIQNTSSDEPITPEIVSQDNISDDKFNTPEPNNGEPVTQKTNYITPKVFTPEVVDDTELSQPRSRPIPPNFNNTQKKLQVGDNLPKLSNNSPKRLEVQNDNPNPSTTNLGLPSPKPSNDNPKVPETENTTSEISNKKTKPKTRSRFEVNDVPKNDVEENDFIKRRLARKKKKANNDTDIIKEDVQNNQKDFINSLKEEREKNKPIVYLVIFNGSQLELVKNLLSDNKYIYNELEDIVRTEDFTIKGFSELSSEIINLMRSTNPMINAAFVYVSDTGPERKAQILKWTMKN